MVDTSLITRIDREVDQAIAQRRIVGAVILVLGNGHVVYQRAAGYADRGANVPVQADTLFRIGSMSKALTSVAVLALVERGEIRLEDPVTRWLPGFRPRLSNGTEPPITVRELLTHTAGLSYPFFESATGPYHRVSSGLDDLRISMADELDRISSAGLLYEPGKEWRYSVSIDVLGAVVAQIMDRPLPEALRVLITGPLATPDSGFTVDDPQRLATPYVISESGAQRMKDPEHVLFPENIAVCLSPSRIFDRTSFPSGGGGMVATAKDYGRFLEAIRTGGGPILEPRTALSMMTNQIGTLPMLLGPGWGFGFGGAVLLDPASAQSPQPVGTWQWSGVFGTSCFVDPANAVSVVILTNSSPEGDSGQFPLNIRDAIYAGAI